MGVVQIQADIQYKHKHNHESHMKAQTNMQQAGIQDTRRTITASKTRQQADIQDKAANRHTRHKKTRQTQ